VFAGYDNLVSSKLSEMIVPIIDRDKSAEWGGRPRLRWTSKSGGPPDLQVWRAGRGRLGRLRRRLTLRAALAAVWWGERLTGPVCCNRQLEASLDNTSASFRMDTILSLWACGDDAPHFCGKVSDTRTIRTIPS
jgi:hypothetical protein